MYFETQNKNPKLKNKIEILKYKNKLWSCYNA